MAMHNTSEQGPLAEVLETITGISPPFDLTNTYDQSDVAEATMLALCDWCSANARPVWATGESIYDAAWLIVERAIENGNI
ncbi:MAG: hypothetical protein WA947_08205 [Phormidesmis sp.]